MTDFRINKSTKIFYISCVGKFITNTCVENLCASNWHFSLIESDRTTFWDNFVFETNSHVQTSLIMFHCNLRWVILELHNDHDRYITSYKTLRHVECMFCLCIVGLCLQYWFQSAFEQGFVTATTKMQPLIQNVLVVLSKGGRLHYCWWSFGQDLSTTCWLNISIWGGDHIRK